jgi:carboxymethylenebutenolidase
VAVWARLWSSRLRPTGGRRSTAPALANDSGRGSVTAPVAVHDVTERDVVLPGVDGDLSGVLLEPDGADGGEGGEGAALASSSAARGIAGLPAVIVVPEIDGFCAGTVAAARRLAEAGYVALALDLYAPYGSAPELHGYEDTIAWLDRLNDRRQVSDLVQALAWLRKLPGIDPARVAIVGFSIGGRYGMMLTTEPHGLRAVVAFYSRPWPGAEIADVALAPGQHVAQFTVPVCAVFGADDDLIPLSMVDDFRHLMAQYPTLGHEVHVVPGRHFFNNESRPRRYNASSAEKGWDIALDFLATRMGPKPSTSSALIT